MTQVNVNSAAAAQVALSRSQSQAIKQPVQQNTAPEQISRLSQNTAKFITAVTNDTKISTTNKRALIDVAALADGLVKNPSARSKVFRDLAGIGVFIGKQAKVEFPYYPTLTGLRYYDTLRDQVQEPVSLEEALAQIEVQLDAVAQSAGAENAQAAVQEVVADPVSRAEISRFVSEDVNVEGFDSGSDQADAPKVSTTA